LKSTQPKSLCNRLLGDDLAVTFALGATGVLVVLLAVAVGTVVTGGGVGLLAGGVILASGSVCDWRLLTPSEAFVPVLAVDVLPVELGLALEVVPAVVPVVELLPLVAEVVEPVARAWRVARSAELVLLALVVVEEPVVTGVGVVVPVEAVVTTGVDVFGVTELVEPLVVPVLACEVTGPVLGTDVLFATAFFAELLLEGPSKRV
jgi:hypothetical protein